MELSLHFFAPTDASEYGSIAALGCGTCYGRDFRLSRRVILILIIHLCSPQIAAAQTGTAQDIAALIEQNQRRFELDAQGCEKHNEEDVIVVCGESRVNREQRVFKGQSDTDENRLRRGEAVSTRRAAACLPGDSGCRIPLPPTVTMGFGGVPPPVIPYDVVMRGLADPENVVLEGSVDSGGRHIGPNPNP